MLNPELKKYIHRALWEYDFQKSNYLQFPRDFQIKDAIKFFERWCYFIYSSIKTERWYETRNSNRRWKNDQ